MKLRNEAAACRCPGATIVREQKQHQDLAPQFTPRFSCVRTTFNGRRSLRMTRRLNCNHHCPCGLSCGRAISLIRHCTQKRTTSRLAAVVPWFRTEGPLIVNNYGLMAPPHFRETDWISDQSVESPQLETHTSLGTGKRPSSPWFSVI